MTCLAGLLRGHTSHQTTKQVEALLAKEYATKHAVVTEECEAVRRSLAEVEAMRQSERDDLERTIEAVKKEKDALHFSSHSSMSELKAQLTTAEHIRCEVLGKLENAAKANEVLHNSLAATAAMTLELQARLDGTLNAQQLLRTIRAIEQRGNIQFHFGTGTVTFLKAIGFKTRVEGKDLSSAEFLNPHEIGLLLKDVADMYDIFHVTMTIEGHTLKHTGEHNVQWVQELAENRARLVVEQLTALGVPAGQMSAVGLPGNHPDSVGQSCVIIRLMIFDDVRHVSREASMDVVPMVYTKLQTTSRQVVKKLSMSGTSTPVATSARRHSVASTAVQQPPNYTQRVVPALEALQIPTKPDRLSKQIDVKRPSINGILPISRTRVFSGRKSVSGRPAVPPVTS